MYKIIGADQKEYGPITSDQIRHWIAEGRINAHTQALAEGTAEWKPLSAFPEFASLLGAAPGISAPLPGIPAAGGLSQAEAAGKVKGPAIALIVTAGLNLLFGLWGLVQRSATMENYSNMPEFSDPQVQKILELSSGPLGLVSSLFQLLVSVLILVAAVRMLALKSYALAFTGAILAVLPCITPCCGVLTLPFGIWALVVLNKAGVKAHFS